MMFRNKNVGLPQPVSIQVLSYAARYRTATDTCKVWVSQKQLLDETRDQHGPIGWLSRSCHSVSGWQLPPAVDLIADAAAEFQRKHGTFREEVNLMCQEGELTTQQATYRTLLPRVFPLNIPKELARRLKLWFPDPLPGDCLSKMIEQSLKASRTMKPTVTLSFVKVLCNGVPTTQRTNTPTLTCKFGCTSQGHCRGNNGQKENPKSAPPHLSQDGYGNGTCQDSLIHYVNCPVVWGFLGSKIHNLNHTDSVSSVALRPLNAHKKALTTALFALHVLVDALQNLMSNRGVNAASQLRDSLRRARMLLHSSTELPTHDSSGEDSIRIL